MLNPSSRTPNKIIRSFLFTLSITPRAFLLVSLLRLRSLYLARLSFSHPQPYSILPRTEVTVKSITVVTGSISYVPLSLLLTRKKQKPLPVSITKTTS